MYDYEKLDDLFHEFYLKEKYRKHKMFLKIGLTPQQARALNKINNHGGTITQNYLRKALHYQPSSTTNMVNILERNGYLLKRLLKNQKKSNYLTLTVKGKSIIEDIQNISKSYNQETFSNLDSDELKNIIHTLKKLNGQS